MNEYINYNGEFYLKNQPIFDSDNRALQYGDGFFETLKFSNGKILFAKNHFERIKRSAQFFKIELPHFFDFNFFKQQIFITAEANSISLHGRIKFIFFRAGGGKYAPEQHDANWMVKITPLYRPDYVWLDNGLHLGIYSEIIKPDAPIANYKVNSAIYFVMASIYLQNSSFDECLLLNQQGRIADAVYANVFLVKDNKIATPSLSEAALDGIMRQQIFEISPELGYQIQEDEVTQNRLLEADEIFLTNAIKGIVWVRSFIQNNNYGCEVSKNIWEVLQQKYLRFENA